MPTLRLPELPSKTDILIVGAGPTGLALSAELRRRGIETVTVDKIVEGDTWAADRHKIAEGVVALTDRMTRMATLRSPAGRALRNVAIGFAGHIPSIGRALARNVAELNHRGSGGGGG
jgi:2-polyprenyl-6-methoxyphenol hydroxylase-like FAD-dependent oxidoreductase